MHKTTKQLNAIVEDMKKRNKTLTVKYRLADHKYNQKEFADYPEKGLDATVTNVEKYVSGVYCDETSIRKPNYAHLTISSDLDKIVKSVKALIEEEPEDVKECAIMCLDPLRLINNEFPIQAVVKQRLYIRQIMDLADDKEAKNKLRDLFIRFNNMVWESLDNSCSRFRSSL